MGMKEFDDADPFGLNEEPAAVAEELFIYLGARELFKAKVSPEDYSFLLSMGAWSYVVNRGNNIYARRGTGHRGRTTIMKHRIVCERAHGPPPSPIHTPDHRDWDTLNNTRENLRWRTPKEQRMHQRR
jgi:hypothetical protein